MPHDEDALRLSRQSFHFSEFLEEQGYEPPPLPGRALVHEHCHQRATGGVKPDRSLLERMGLEVEVPDSGCCGMAGGWGYEAGHYDVSVACAERVLLPKVREASPDTLIVANGFSCRSQIEQAETGRRALHLAEVLKLARERGPELGLFPEHAAGEAPSGNGRRGRAVALGAAGAVAAAGGVLAARALR